MTRTFHVVIEKDEDGIYIGKVPELRGCVSQGDTIDELMKNMREAVELCLEVQDERNPDEGRVQFIGVQKIEVV
jgi:predicted RNase H-like HicB family nuclease